MTENIAISVLKHAPVIDKYDNEAYKHCTKGDSWFIIKYIGKHLKDMTAYKYLNAMHSMIPLIELDR
jgi:hypothetical protein